MKIIDIMLDLESLSTKTNASIIQLSAVVFDLNNGNTFETFDQFVDPKSSIEKGLDVDGDTMAWWLQQEAFDMVLNRARNEGLQLEEVLKNFSKWIKKVKKAHKADKINVWGNGPAADNVWIRSAYDVCNLECPVLFFVDACVRTMVLIGSRLLNVDPKKTMKFKGVKHNAIDDCKHQIRYICSVSKLIIKGNKALHE